MKNRLIALAIVASLTSSFAVNAKMVTTSKAFFPTAKAYTTTDYKHKRTANSHKFETTMTIASHNTSKRKFYDTKVSMFLPYYQWWTVGLSNKA